MSEQLNAYRGYFRHLELYKDEYCVDCFDVMKCGSESGKLLNATSDIVKQLVEKNMSEVIRQIKQGNRNMEQLLEIASKVSVGSVEKRVMEFTFIGIRITTDCNLYGNNRCRYCDQKRYKGKLDTNRLKEEIASLSYDGKRRGISASISGGEPLLLYDDLFGKGQLVRDFYEKGYIVNMNSNLHLIAPHSVLPIINSGLASIHTSFDASIERVHDKLVCKGAMHRVLEGIKYIQDIKRIFNISYPVVHINVVATKENLFLYDKLLEFLLQYKLPSKDLGLGTPYTSPNRMDLSPHLILLGGESNSKLMPDADDWNRFEHEILPKCREIWNNYLDKNAIIKTRMNTFDRIHYNSNPLKERNVIHNNEKESFRHCYIAPTQIYIVSNGDCYACGCHADAANAPILGNIYRESIDDIVRKNLKFYMEELPHSDYCAKCAKNTRRMNVLIENKLKASIQLLMLEEDKKICESYT